MPLYGIQEVRGSIPLSSNENSNPWETKGFFVKYPSFNHLITLFYPLQQAIFPIYPCISLYLYVYLLISKTREKVGIRRYFFKKLGKN
jgi:hypothetical protein